MTAAKIEFPFVTDWFNVLFDGQKPVALEIGPFVFKLSGLPDFGDYNFRIWKYNNARACQYKICFKMGRWLDQGPNFTIHYLNEKFWITP